MWVEPHADDALDSYLRAVGAHGLLVAAVFLATLLATVAWLSQRSPVYKATAQLVINPLPQGDETFLGLPVIVDSGDPTRTMQTAAALLESPAAARATALRLGGDWTAQRVLDHVDLEPAGESNILAVTAKAGTGKEAAQVANVFAAATLRQRAGALRRATSSVIDRLVKTTVTSPTYAWRASGRWMVRGLQVAKPGQPGVYGPDLLDRWKGRAFQQSPDSTISLVGFEDEGRTRQYRPTRQQPR